ncbi:CoA transferase [Candidatus Amarobacter glycogenicus]|uniref:CaiB/BaiF CoA transferase family protein n=1 Tax=Candidatus Amarobacter glycogenicus TaxID=3140699 RepID=UPI0031368581|nr:CoA transferase [Dehalococcoidia bacterium]
MSGPFDGLKVLELGRFIAVPVCGQLLAEGGADVIKVEDLDGDQTRHNGPIMPFEGRQYFNKNRGKRSISVRITEPEVLAAIQKLAAAADIVLANFRPGMSESLGLDYESVRAMNPRVIYGENTAYGLEGPMAPLAGMDMALQALTGLAHMTETGPEPLVNPIIDYAAAMLMAWGVSTALYHRERTGHGQRLNVALMHAAMFLENNQLTHVELLDSWRGEFVRYLKHAFADGKTWADVIEHRETLLPHKVVRAYYGFHATKDGTVGVACNARTQRLKLMSLLGIDDRWTSEPGWMPEDAHAHADYVYRQVATAFAQQPTAHWIAALEERGLPIAPVRHSDELFFDAQVKANNFLAEVEHEVLGPIKVVAPPLRMTETPLAPRPPVSLGKNTREILAEAGLGAGQIDGLFARGAVREVHETLEDLL